MTTLDYATPIDYTLQPGEVLIANPMPKELCLLWDVYRRLNSEARRMHHAAILTSPVGATLARERQRFQQTQDLSAAMHTAAACSTFISLDPQAAQRLQLALGAANARREAAKHLREGFFALCTSMYPKYVVEDITGAGVRPHDIPGLDDGGAPTGVYALVGLTKDWQDPDKDTA